MLKHNSLELILNLVLFSHFILQSGSLRPGATDFMQESGDKLEPNDHGGICVRSNLGNVFCSNINTQIFS